jgi:hypothetical protein
LLTSVINEEDAILIHPQKLNQEIFWQIFPLGIFWDRVSHYATTPLIVALSPGHSDILVTRFRPWSPIVTGNHWIAPNEKILKVTKTIGTIDVFALCSGISGPTSRRASARSNLHK